MNKRPELFRKRLMKIKAKKITMLLVLVSFKYSRSNFLSKIIPDRLLGISTIMKKFIESKSLFSLKEKAADWNSGFEQTFFSFSFQSSETFEIFLSFFFLSSTPQVLILHVKAYFSQPVKIISFLVFTVVRIPF